jgi:hypothetical protein
MDVKDPTNSVVEGRAWAYSGLVAALLLLPALHYSAHDFEDRSVGGVGYVARIESQYLTIALAAGLGLAVTVLLVIHLAGLRRFGHAQSPLLADACVAIGALAILGLSIGFVTAAMAAYGASEGQGYEIIAPLGAFAENFAVCLLPALAGPAVLIAVLSLRRKTLPRVLGYTAAFFAVILTALGVLLPGVGALPAILWLVIMTGTLSFYRPSR